MQLLFVEDDDEIVEAIRAALVDGCPEVVVHRAASAAEAMEALQSELHFDLGIFDLKIPTASGVPDHDPAHGQAVFYAAVSERPGLVTWIFSGFAEDDFKDELIQNPRTGDPYGNKQVISLVRHFRKAKMPDLIDSIAAAAAESRELSLVDLSFGGANVTLSADEAKLLRILLRRHDAKIGQVTAYEPGFSGTRVFGLVGLGQGGQQVLNCVVKVGPRDVALEEHDRFTSGVAGVLPAGCFAPISECLVAGGGRLGLVCYTLAGVGTDSLLSVLSAADDRATAVVDALVGQIRVWTDGGFVEEMSPTDVLTRLGAPPPDDLDPDRRPTCDPGLVVAALGRPVHVRSCVQHGDLHATNVLVAAGDNPVLIDYGRTAQRIAPYDPVSLELGLYFHPEGRGVMDEWPTPEQAAGFDDLDAYLDGCPAPAFVRRCRQWAHDCATSDREVWLAMLAVALRQLTFPDPPERAIAVATRALQLLA